MENEVHNFLIKIDSLMERAESNRLSLISLEENIEVIQKKKSITPPKEESFDLTEKENELISSRYPNKDRKGIISELNERLYKRGLAKKKEREETNQQEKELIEILDLEECTFKPRITPPYLIQSKENISKAKKPIVNDDIMRMIARKYK